ncbi:MAG: hypothetical protein DMG21_19090 [Acidobacteria bacterium]|nr:MAG: hypothetical protein DMG21_19090 [Acidobacteriota bacterium]
MKTIRPHHHDGLVAEKRSMEPNPARWQFTNFVKWATPRCCLCGERIEHGKIIMRVEGPSHLACHRQFP